MMINNLVKTGLLEKALDATNMRNEAISQNIANVDTPNYKRKTVSFEDVLQNTVDTNGIRGIRTNSRHIPIGEGSFDGISPTFKEDNSANKMRLDGNNVDVNIEMASMAKNTLKYSSLIERLNGKYRELKSAISEGRR